MLDFMMMLEELEVFMRVLKGLMKTDMIGLG